MASPRNNITGGSAASASSRVSLPPLCLPTDRTAVPTLSGDMPPPAEEARERDLDLERVTGPRLLLSPPPLLLPLEGETEDPLEEDRRVSLPPLLVLRDLDLLFLLLWVPVVSLCPFLCLREVVEGLDAFLPYRRAVWDGGRSGDTEVEGSGTAALDAESVESPTGGVELVTGVNTVSLLTCTSHNPVTPYRLASFSNFK